MPRGTQVINGRTYVYEYKSVWEPEKRRSKQVRNYIGRMENGEFIPNKKYQLQKELEVRESVKKPALSGVCVRLFAGATRLLDAIGKKIGVTEDIMACFPEDGDEILSLAYYLVLESQNSLYRFKRWSATHEHPAVRDIPSQRSSELLRRITEDGKMRFFARQSQRRMEGEYLAYDTTSVSSYSQMIEQVKYGKNKDHNPLAQINLALLFGEESGLPVFYKKLPGNITDVMTVMNMLRDMEFLDIKKLKLVMDRGFYSEANINELYRRHHKFLTGTKLSSKFVSREFAALREGFLSRPNFNSKTGLYIRSVTAEWDYSEAKPRLGKTVKEKRRLYVHFYYNDQHATDDRVRLNKMLDILEGELVSGKRNMKHEKLYSKYFEVKNTPVRGVHVEPRQDMIDEAEKDYGYFVLLSNSVRNPVRAIELYRNKDMVEKAFYDLKDRLSLRRTSVSSEENLEGKIFIQFVALIFQSYIKKAMDEHSLFKSYTMQEMLDELDVIELYKQPGKKEYFGETTEKQRSLYRYMGVDVPA
jgi:transposase